MKCPVCQDEMENTINLYIMRCKEKKLWLPQLKTVEGLKVNTHVDVTHSIIYTNPDTGKQELKVFEIPPYIFKICDYEGAEPYQRTEISERVLRNFGLGEVRSDELEVISFPTAIDLPWHDAAQVLDRVKMYLLFS